VKVIVAENRVFAKIRKNIFTDVGDIKHIAYHSGMELADTLMMGYGEILMAVEGYGESGYEAAARGLSPDAIQMLGINSAMSNVLTDKILLRACRGQHGFVRSVTEGSAGAAYEWLLTDTVDNWVSGDLSRESSYYRTALAEGQTPEEAKATICEIRKQELLQAMAVGGTMSGMAWGYGRAVDYLINRINPGQVSTDTPESVTPLQEEGISEILEVGSRGEGVIPRGEGYPDVVQLSVNSIISGVESGDIPLINNIQKGNYGEMKMDIYFEGQGYERISLDRVVDLNTPTHQGVDGVYYNPNGHPPYIIAEAKYGTARLTNTRDGLQMSDTWINGSDRLVHVVGKDVADDILLEGYGKILVNIGTDGEIAITNIE